MDPPDPDSSHQATYCAQLSETISSLAFNHNDQLIVNSPNPHLATIHEHNCATRIPQLQAHGDIVEPARAALSFMIAAAPDSSLSDSIVANFDALLAGISSTTESHLVGDSEGGSEYVNIIEFLHNVPGTVGPVRARLAYVQTPENDCHTKLALVWKLEVPMENVSSSSALISEPQPEHELTNLLNRTGTKQPSPRRMPLALLKSSIGPRTPVCRRRRSRAAITSGSGDRTILNVVTARLRSRPMTRLHLLSAGTRYLLRMTQGRPMNALRLALSSTTQPRLVIMSSLMRIGRAARTG